MVILLLGAYAAKKASLWGFLSLPTLGLRNTSSQAAPQDHRAFIFICVSPAPNTVPGGLSVNGLCLWSSGLHHCVLIDNDPSSLTSSRDLRPLTVFCTWCTQFCPFARAHPAGGPLSERSRCSYAGTWELVSCCRAGYWLLPVSS